MVMLGLSGDIDTIVGVLIPKVSQISVRNMLVAVAVRAISLTSGDKKLRTFPKHAYSILKLSPLKNL